MDYPDDLWSEILHYVVNGSDLTRLMLTGDLRARRVLKSATEYRLSFPPETSEERVQSAILSSSMFDNLEIVTLHERILNFRSPILGPTTIFSGDLLSRFPLHLHTLILEVRDLWIHPMHLALLPKSLKHLEAPIYFARDGDSNLAAPVDPAGVVWPELEDLRFRGALGKSQLNRELLERLPTTLTRLEGCTMDYDALEPCPLHRLVNVIRFRSGSSMGATIWLPPNVTDLELDYTSTPSRYFASLPRSVVHLRTMSSAKMGSSHATCYAKDLALLPRELKTFKTHELVDWKHPELLGDALPPGLETLSYRSCTLKGLEYLPSTITDLSVEITQGEDNHHPPVSTLFPRLRALSLANTVFYSLPASFFESLPFSSIVSLNFGVQPNITANVWSQLPKQLETLICRAEHKSMTLLHFVTLPPNLKTLELCVQKLPIRDEHVAKLPRRLTSLRLLGGDELTDACFPSLPRHLESLDLPSNYNFTVDSIPHWPVALSYIQVGTTTAVGAKTLSQKRIAALFGNATVILLYRTE